ncbi:DUF5320 domain-containing protein, partial [Desulfofundulus sp.]|uniref:DUF5320 domain-containing protein n=1 Tax=Desulfofundulus sp. TaxID=2282750 RepID=UPI003C727F27
GMGRRGAFWWGGFPPSAGTSYPPYFPSSPEHEAGFLKAHISHLENILQTFKQRLEQIQGKQKEQAEQE